MLTDLDTLAAEAEGDRLSRIYVQITMLARAQRSDFIQARLEHPELLRHWKALRNQGKSPRVAPHPDGCSKIRWLAG